MAGDRGNLRTLGVDPVLLHHDAVTAVLRDVVDVEVAVSTGQHQPGLSAKTGDGHDIWQTSGRDCHGGEGTRLVESVCNLTTNYHFIINIE